MAPGSDLRPVDELEVCVVVDDVLDLLSTVPPSVTPELPNLIAAGATELSGSCSCCAAWGLSLLIRTSVAGERRTVLFDAGPEGDTVRANARKLGLDFAGLDAVALSHGHWDHAGGLESVLGLVGHPVPMHVNPGMFEARGFKLPSGTVLPMGDVPSPAALFRAARRPGDSPTRYRGAPPGAILRRGRGRERARFPVAREVRSGPGAILFALASASRRAAGARAGGK